MTTETAVPRERASKAEMKFAGHYLNLAGIMLVLFGLSSYLKSTEVSTGASGILESILTSGLGFALLVAGENFFRKKLEQFAHPLLTGGFCLLFFAVTSAHFRYGLIGQGALFSLLLVLVVASNASVFRYDSKLIGNVMLVVYFFTPLFMTFSFEYFAGIFCYLLAINLGTTVVAFYKKWDFQLLVAGLGSYALYFFHFRSAHGHQSLILLLVIYGLALTANNAIYFSRREGSSYNLVLSFVSPSAFAAFSSLVVLGLPNWIPVTLYAALAVVHGVLAKAADARREQNPMLAALAATNLVLCILFLSASISFVTYFSDNTAYFGLVTILWFLVALVLLWGGFQFPRYRLLLNRFSFFALAMATTQVFFVLPSMEGSAWVRMLAVLLNACYFANLYVRRKILTVEEGRVQGLVACIGLVEPAKMCTELVPLELASGTLLLLLAFTLWLSHEVEDVSFLKYLAHPMAAVALYFSARSFAGLTWLSLPLGVVVLALVVSSVVKRDYKAGPYWFWVGLFVMRISLLGFQMSAGLGVTTLAAASVCLIWLGGIQKEAWQFGPMSELCNVAVLLFLSFGEILEPMFVIATMATLLSSYAVAQGTTAVVSQSNTQIHVLILVRVLLLMLAPYPMLCVLCLSLAALGLMRLGLVWPSVFCQAMLSVGVLFLPSHHFQGLAGSGVVGVLLLFQILAYASIKSHAEKVRLEQWTAGFGVLLFVRFSLMLQTESLSTLSWSLLAFGLLALNKDVGVTRNWQDLGQGLFDYSRLLFFAAFLKSILLDANISTTVGLLHFFCSAVVAVVFVLAGHNLVVRTDVRNAFVILGLLIFCFQTTLLLHQTWGYLMVFQPMLSGFWALTAFLVIACGVVFQVKVYRLFGLVTMVANTLKILLVDIQVLDSYSQTNTYLILGSLLIMTSLLYQKQRARLEGTDLEPVALPLSPSVAS